MIDWILAEQIARFVAGTGDATPPQVDLPALASESERRVVAYTGSSPRGPCPAPEGIGRREWVASNIGSMRKLLEPVLERAGTGLGPLRPAVQIGFGFALSAEVGVVVGYLGPARARAVRAGAARRGTGRTRRGCCSCSRTSAAPSTRFGADEQEFMTWVALHEVTHAVQFAGVPWLQGHLAGLMRELLKNAEVRLDRERKLRLPTREQVARVVRRAAFRRSDRDRREPLRARD